MRYSQAFIPTRKDDPADAEMPSHKLLIRAGYMEQVAAGIYTLLPLGWKSVRKIEEIIRQELDRAGAQEILMPMVQPAELWQRSGRWGFYGPELLRFTDRKSQEYCLGPTHEEVITDLVRRHVRSYRDMPLNLYQVQVKFRDEVRPRGGLLRGREFIMKDAYSFDVDQAGALVAYEKMRVAYTRIFERCGLDFRRVEADTGAIGGTSSHEFQVLAQTGEDRIISCSTCAYTANVEMARFKRQTADTTTATSAACEPVSTPGKHTVGEVAQFLKVAPSSLLKTLIYLADNAPIVAIVPGDRELNEVKLKGLLKVNELHLATDAVVTEVTGAPVGFAGPVGLDFPIFADLGVELMHDAVTGANQGDTHLIHVEPGRDFKPMAYVDLAMASEGDFCPSCSEKMVEFRGIEVGHIFVLGTKYSEPMGATFLDPDGDAKPIVMGCYGIGVTRVLAAAIEQNHDADGIIWPSSIAPYQVIILPLQLKDEAVVAAGEQLYNTLADAGLDVLLDDRDLRPGGKFKDADLIGIPYRVTIGSRGLADGKVELKHRRDAQPELIEVNAVLEHLQARLRNEHS